MSCHYCDEDEFDDSACCKIHNEILDVIIMAVKWGSEWREMVCPNCPDCSSTKKLNIVCNILRKIEVLSDQFWNILYHLDADELAAVAMVVSGNLNIEKTLENAQEDAEKGGEERKLIFVANLMKRIHLIRQETGFDPS